MPSHEDNTTTSNTIGCLSLEQAKKVVRYAHRRLDKSGIHEFTKDRLDPQHQVQTVEQEDIELGDHLGSGSFSSVYEIKSIRDQPAENLVVKLLQPKLANKLGLFAGCSTDLVKEGMILATLQHSNILACRAWSPGGADAYASGRHDAFFLVLDRLEETLQGRLQGWKKSAKKGFFSFHKEKKLRKTLMERSEVFLDIAKATAFLHSQRILHRDLKPDNIGFDHDGVLKIFDFDVARILPKESLTNTDATFKMTRRVGSPRYMSPECARGDHYNAKADVYTVALLCYELLSLEKPYGDMPKGEHYQQVFIEGVRPQCPKSWPAAMRTLLTNCWSQDIDDRPVIEEMIEEFQAVLPKMLPASADAIRSNDNSSKGNESTTTLRTAVEGTHVYAQ